MQTSAKTLDAAVQANIEQEFYKTILELPPAKLESFLRSFFSETEQIVFFKRFAVLKLIVEGKSYNQIESQLKVSSATISSISKLAQEEAIQETMKELAASTWAENMADKFFDRFSFLKKKTQAEENTSTPAIDVQADNVPLV